MKKLWIAAAALLIGLSFATPAAWAGRTAVIEQVGDGKLTVMMQSKRHFIGVTYNNPSQQKLDSVVPLMTHKKNTGLGRAKGGRCGAGAQHSGHGVNNATVAQVGLGNRAAIKQTGSGNHAVAVQNGDNNTSYIMQNGTRQSAQTVQTGNNNVAIILQQC